MSKVDLEEVFCINTLLFGYWKKVLNFFFDRFVWSSAGHADLLDIAILYFINFRDVSHAFTQYFDKKASFLLINVREKVIVIINYPRISVLLCLEKDTSTLMLILLF